MPDPLFFDVRCFWRLKFEPRKTPRTSLYALGFYAGPPFFFDVRRPWRLKFEPRKTPRKNLYALGFYAGPPFFWMSDAPGD